jgi:hypothetical protein
MFDGMFSILRKKHGQVEDAEYVAYEQSADQAMKIWKELGLSYTPSSTIFIRKLFVPWRKWRAFGRSSREEPPKYGQDSPTTCPPWLR